MSVFYRDIDVKISDYKSELSKPLVIYERDRGLEIYFNLKEYAYKYDKKPSNLLENLVGAYATVTLVNPAGDEININEVEITKEAKVKFVITEDLTDELTEIGIYQLQIHVNNDVEGRDTSVFSIPPFNFEVRERLKGNKGEFGEGELLDSEGNRLTDKEGYRLVNTSTNKIINFSTDKINEYLGSIPTIQGEIKNLNSQLDDIIQKNSNGLLFDISEKIKGASIYLPVSDVSNEAQFINILNKCKDSNCNTITICPIMWMTNNTGNTFDGYKSPLNEATITDRCKKAKELGFKVALKPHVGGEGISSHGDIKPSNVSIWLDNYTELFISLVSSCKDYIDIICVNNELNGQTNQLRDKWINLIKSLRNIKN